jgi:hypothetical protein
MGPDQSKHVFWNNLLLSYACNTNVVDGTTDGKCMENNFWAHAHDVVYDTGKEMDSFV